MVMIMMMMMCSWLDYELTSEHPLESRSIGLAGQDGRDRPRHCPRMGKGGKREVRTVEKVERRRRQERQGRFGGRSALRALSFGSGRKSCWRWKSPEPKLPEKAGSERTKRETRPTRKKGREHVIETNIMLFGTIQGLFQGQRHVSTKVFTASTCVLLPAVRTKIVKFNQSRAREATDLLKFDFKNRYNYIMCLLLLFFADRKRFSMFFYLIFVSKCWAISDQFN